MYDGTLGTKGPWQALVTFQQLIILADKHGVVDMTADAVSRRTTIPLDIIERGLTELERPDPDSRSPDEGGRRIVRLSDTRVWGWRLVNYEHYRKLRNEDERREYHKLYARTRRASTNVNKSTPSQQSQPMAVSNKQDAVSSNTIAAPKTGAVTVANKNKKGSLPPYDALFEEAWVLYPPKPKNTKTAAWRQWLARAAEGVDPIVMLAGTKGYADSVRREGTEPRFVKLASTFYGRDRHFEASFAPVAHEPSEDDLLRTASPEQRRRIARIEQLLVEDAAEEARAAR